MMKRFIYISIALILASCGSQKSGDISLNSVQQAPAKEAASVAAPSVKAPVATVQSILAEAEKGGYRKGELLVRYKTGTAAAASARMNSAVGAKSVRKFPLVNAEQVKLPEGVSVKDAVSRYMQDPDVLYAEPNYLRYPMMTPNDTYFNPQQWALDNTGTYASGTVGDDIGMPQAWDLTQGSRDVIVADIDSGVDYNHPDLVNNIWINTGEDCNNGIDDDGNGYIDDCQGWNFPAGTNDPMDDFGHGTHVAGIIGAVGNNGQGIAGVMWNVRIMPLKFISQLGPVACGGEEGFCGDVADEVAAIQYAVDNGAKVINASYGAETFSQDEHDAISAANDAGVLFVAAAGNGSLDTAGDNNDIMPEYPAGYNLPNIIAVAATDQNDERASFSNFGPNSVQVAAPGVYILSTVPTMGVAGSFSSFCTSSFFTGYEICSGTSMAAPHVAGLAGLLESYYTNFDYGQVRSTILRYVDGRPTLNGWVKTGGRVNAYKALSSLLAPTDLDASSTLPSEVSLSWSDNATGEDGYTVERKTGDGGYAVVQTLGPDAAGYTDSGLVAGTTYTYRVRAFNNIGESLDGPGNVATVTTPGSAPSAETGGSGGGCSVATRPGDSTAPGDIAVFLLPLVVLFVIKRVRRRKA
ncbi:MAG: S8 family serine peptidase [Candidatus Sulfobium sp.]|jgi:serine protease